MKQRNIEVVDPIDVQGFDDNNPNVLVNMFY